MSPEMEMPGNGSVAACEARVESPGLDAVVLALDLAAGEAENSPPVERLGEERHAGPVRSQLVDRGGERADRLVRLPRLLVGARGREELARDLRVAVAAGGLDIALQEF